MASFVKFETVLIVFSLFLIQIVYSRLFDKSRSSKVISKNIDELPFCNGELAVCGMVQYNSFGTFSQPLCRCKKSFSPELNSLTNGGSCPMSWDAFDGQTHIHALDQYKFCGGAPELKTCKTEQTAYLSLNRIDRLTGARLENTHLLLCKCPVGHILMQDTKNVKFYEFERQSVQLTHQLCAPIPTCAENQICAAVTRTSNSTLIRRNCKCSSSSICPSSSFDFAIDKQEFRKGSVYTFKCISN